MAKLSYSRQALADLERLSNFLAINEPSVALHTLELIDEAIAILRRSRQNRYLALYSYEEAHDAVLILSIRHQREAGFHTGA